jgi:hypothetical protein
MPVHELNHIFLLDCKFILSKYDINSTRCIEAEDSVEVKQVL